MHVFGIVLILHWLCFVQVYCQQCEQDECFQQYNALIASERDNVQRIFDDILEKYGDIDNVLMDLLTKLKKTMLDAEYGLNNLESDNKKIESENINFNLTISTLLNDLGSISEILKGLKNNPGNWSTEIEDANNSANVNINSTFTTLEEINELENELVKWVDFLKRLDGNVYSKDITNIQHSISADLDLLESILEQNQDVGCLKKFQEDLKKVFIELSKLIRFEGLEERIRKMNEKAMKNKEDASEILSKSEEILKDEEKLKEVRQLVNDTLNLAEDLNRTKSDIDNVETDTKQLYRKKFNNYQKELQKLYNKYNIQQFEKLLKELENVNEEIEKSDVDITAIEKEIDNNVHDLNCYTCFFQQCKYRKALESEATNGSNCTNSCLHLLDGTKVT